MFETGGLRRAVIEVYNEELTHFFKELNDEEFVQFSRELAERGDGEVSVIEYKLCTYNARCRKVEGYTCDGVDLMTEHPESWRGFIPASHKCAAFDELVTGERAKKKSTTISTDSATPTEAVQEK